MRKAYRILLLCLCFSLAAAKLTAQPAGSTTSRDNALVDLSAGLINAAVTRDIDQTDKVNDVIMGNPVYGSAHTRGKVTAQPVPDAGNGVVDMWIRGTIVSDTVAVPPEKDLLIYSTTYITFVVRKRIYVNDSGIYSFPTQARARAVAKLRKITNLKGEPAGPLVTTIVEEAFDVTKPRSEQIAVDKAETQLIKNLDDQLGPQLAQGNAAYTAALRQLDALCVPLRRLHFFSTQSQLTMAATLLRPGQQPAIAAPPKCLSPFDLAARVHQSAVDETAQAVLGGKSFNVEDLSKLPTGTSKTASMQAQMVQHYLGSMPHDLGVKGLSLTFADNGPITAAFADQCVTLTIRIKEISTGVLRLPGLTMRTVYRIENKPGGVELVRQGHVQVEPFYHARIGNHVLGVVLQGSLDHVFPSYIAVPSLNAPAELKQIGTLVPAHGDANDGWLMLTWVRKGTK